MINLIKKSLKQFKNLWIKISSKKIDHYNRSFVSHLIPTVFSKIFKISYWIPLNLCSLLDLDESNIPEKDNPAQKL